MYAVAQASVVSRSCCTAFSQSLSFFFGDVSGANEREVSHGPRDPKRFGREKKRGKE